MPSLHRAITNPYGRAHRQRRAALIRDALGTCCPGTRVNGVPYRSANCTGWMTDPRRMHLDHSTPVVFGGTHGDVIICAPCNLGAGATLGNTLRAPQPQPRRRASRVW